MLVERAEGGPRYWFQQVPEPKTAKNRGHLDLRADDPGAELARLRYLGALVADDQPNAHVIALTDPEGNEFCLLRPG